MATIKEIAQHCGVSTATVSKALNGYTDISPETSEIIRAAAARMGYYPNSAARALKTNRTFNLGVLFDEGTRTGLAHEYFSSLLESFKSQAEKLGYDVTFLSNNLGNVPMSYLEHCRYRKCDGVLVACANFSDEQIIQLVASEIPVVTIDHVFNSSPAIMADNVNDMRSLTDYILDRGHRKIAYIHGEDTAVTRKRLATFHQALRDRGLSVPPEYLKQGRFHDPDTSRRMTRELMELPEPPTCILFPDDISAIGGINEFEKMGLKVPANISMAAYDGIALSQMLRPRLTTLRQDSQALGAAAASRLVKSIEDPRTDFPDQTLIRGELIKGQSVRSLIEATV
jgi:LacI family transcriptional regulator